jgi:hypothetical protein
VHHAFELSIRTPCTPPRWVQFEAELQAAWERFVAAVRNPIETRPNAVESLTDALLKSAELAAWERFVAAVRGPPRAH